MESKTFSLFDRAIEYDADRIPDPHPRVVLFEPDGVNRIPAVLSSCTAGRTVSVLMDTRTADIAGTAAATALIRRGWSVREVVVEDPAQGQSPICDDCTFDRLSPRVSGSDIVLTVGSGVVTDLGKWIASEQGIPFVALATACSMNGYASANVAATLKGIKSIHRARPPRAIVADPRILSEAPYEMTAAGLGDLLAKSVSSADWFLNHLIFGDAFDPKIVDLIADIEPLYLDHPKALKRRDPKAIEAVFKGLILTGVAMTLVGSSTPASGGEHLISHTLDMMASLDGRPHDLHGRQVGVGTILTAELYRRVLQMESIVSQEPAEAIDPRFWGHIASIVETEYREKIPRLRKAALWIAQPENWNRFRQSVAPFLRSPDRIRDCLKEAGAAHTAKNLGMDRSRLLKALRHGHELRSRFTILDLAYLVGLLPKDSETIVDKWS